MSPISLTSDLHQCPSLACVVLATSQLILSFGKRLLKPPFLVDSLVYCTAFYTDKYILGTYTVQTLRCFCKEPTRLYLAFESLSFSTLIVCILGLTPFDLVSVKLRTIVKLRFLTKSRSKECRNGLKRVKSTIVLIVQT